MIAIIDYGMGNTKSVYNAFKLLGEDIILTDNKKELEIANALVLPGVGSFSDGMKNLHERNLVEPLNELVIFISLSISLLKKIVIPFNNYIM